MCKQAEKAAAEAEAQRGGAFHLVHEARVVEAQPADGRAQVVEVGAVDGEEAGEHHRLGRLEVRQRRLAGALFLRDRVADAGVGHLLDAGGEEADLAGVEGCDLLALGAEDADLLDLIGGVGVEQLDALAFADVAVDDAGQHHDAEIGVIPGIDQQRLERRIAIAFRRRQALDDGLQHLGHADAGLGRDLQRARGVDADDVLDLLADAVGLGGRQIDLVEDGDDLVVDLDGLVDVGQRLGLDALAGVDHQQRPFDGGERSVHLIGEIDMARRVDQIELVHLAVLGGVFEPDRLGLDGDAAFALDLHRIEHLLAHLAQGEPAADLDEAVGQRRLAVVDMRNDGEIADVGGVRHGRRYAGRG
jgi:hypothetical protein